MIKIRHKIKKFITFAEIIMKIFFRKNENYNKNSMFCAYCLPPISYKISSMYAVFGFIDECQVHTAVPDTLTHSYDQYLIFKLIIKFINEFSHYFTVLAEPCLNTGSLLTSEPTHLSSLFLCTYVCLLIYTHTYIFKCLTYLIF